MEQAACLKLTRQKLQFKHTCTKQSISHPTQPLPQNLGTMDQQEGNQLTPTVQNKESTAAVTKITIQIIQSGFFLSNNVTNIFVQSSKAIIFVVNFRGRPWYCWSTYCYHLMILTNLLAHGSFYISQLHVTTRDSCMKSFRCISKAKISFTTTHKA